MKKTTSNFVEFTELDRVKVTIQYRVPTSVEPESMSMTYTVKEIEADLNNMRGADNSLHPNWQWLGPADLDNFLSQLISSVVRNPILHEPDDEEAEEGVITRRVVVAPSMIEGVIVEGMYAEA